MGVAYVMFMLTFDSMKVTNPLLSAPGPPVPGGIRTPEPSGRTTFEVAWAAGRCQKAGGSNAYRRTRARDVHVRIHATGEVRVEHVTDRSLERRFHEWRLRCGRHEVLGQRSHRSIDREERITVERNRRAVELARFGVHVSIDAAVSPEDQVPPHVRLHSHGVDAMHHFTKLWEDTPPMRQESLHGVVIVEAVGPAGEMGNPSSHGLVELWRDAAAAARLMDDLRDARGRLVDTARWIGRHVRDERQAWRTLRSLPTCH